MSLRPTPVDFPLRWAALSEVAQRVIQCEGVSRNQWNSSFTDVYAMCVARPESHAETLYMHTCQLLEQRVTDIGDELSQVPNDQLLPQYVQRWETFSNGLNYLNNLYSYVNMQYVKNRRPNEPDISYGNAAFSSNDHNMEIQELGMDYWKNLILRLEDRLTACLLREVKNDREDQIGPTGSACLTSVLDSFIRVEQLRQRQKKNTMTLYKRIFQDGLLRDTVDFCSRWAAEKEASLSCSEYVTEALNLRDRETARAKQYYRFSLTEVSNVFQEIIVTTRLRFINQNVREMVTNENRQDLGNMFKLLAPNDLCEDILKSFSDHVRNDVSHTIANISTEPTQAPTQFVERLITIRSRYACFIQEVFNNEPDFRNIMDKAFNKAINERSAVVATGGRVIVETGVLCALPSTPSSPSSSPMTSSVGSAQETTFKLPRPAELLSKYVDSILRRVTKGSEADIEEKLNNVIVLFKYIDEKDLFQKYYQRMLCKRLINAQSTLLEAEEGMINRLRTVCGYEFTSKFHRMFNDVQLVTELNHRYQTYMEKHELSYKFTCYFHILTQCSWPLSERGLDFSLPTDLHQCLSNFEQFYTEQHHGRKLRWVHHHSTVEMRLGYGDKPYQITMSSLQASALLHLDALDKDKITVSELAVGIQIDNEKEVAKLMQTFVDAKLFLQKSENTFELNRGYTNRRLKLKITSGIPIKEASLADTEQVERQVADDRRFFIQAAIVRIMKSRKRLKHSMLIKEVIDQAKSRFQPPVPVIKRCIENLMDKGYLERTPGTSDEYSYLA